MSTRSRRTRTAIALVTTGAAVALTTTQAVPATAGGGHGHGPHPRTVLEGLDGPRGLDVIKPGVTLVSESDGSFSLVLERRHKPAKVIELSGVDPGFAPAVAAGKHGWFYILTGAGGEPGGEQPPGAATLYKWRWGWDAPVAFADIAAYQETDPDPYDLEGLPAESNPFGLTALKDGSLLVADAAGNDLLRVWRNGHIKTVAVLKPRTVEVPEGFPPTDPDGNPLPPAGTPIPSEAVATSVTVGPDGYWYVGELRGFPATVGTSQVWRIKPGSVGATCDPEAPYSGRCKRFAEGLTSVVDLGSDGRSVYGVTLSKLSWLALELGAPGGEVGSLFKIRRHRGYEVDELITPGGVDGAKGSLYVTGPVFGPGSLVRYR